MNAPTKMDAFERLVTEQGGTVSESKIKLIADRWKPILAEAKNIRYYIDYKLLGALTLAVIVIYLLSMMLPQITGTKPFQWFSRGIGETATFIMVPAVLYAAYRTSSNLANGFLFAISLIHILSWSVIAAVLKIASNTTFINDRMITRNLEHYGGGHFGDMVGTWLINGAYNLLGEVHPAMVLPTALMLLSSIFLGNPLPKFATILHYLIPEEQSKKVGEIKVERVKAEKKPETGLIEVLKLYGFNAKIKGEPQVGPSITRHKIQLTRGAKTKQLESFSKDIARDLKLKKIHIDTAGDGDGTINIETENRKRDTVYLRDLLDSDAYLSAPRRSIILGVNAANKNDVIVRDLHEMPHLLVAGTTGGGKSVGLNAMLISLLYKNSPEQMKLILLDPKLVELTPYNGLPHLLLPVETNAKKVPAILDRAIAEMEYRYTLMAANGVRSIDELNKKIKTGKRVINPMHNYTFADKDVTHSNDAFKHQPFSETHHQLLTKFIPDIVIVADEFADMMKVAKKQIEEKVDRLAAKARAANIIEILATQRPTVEVITGNIKANIPSRLAFNVATSLDSVSILDRKDAKNLLGKGDSFFLSQTGELLRIQSPFSSDQEVARFIKTGSLITENMRKAA